jgi:hypothetical protein
METVTDSEILVGLYYNSLKNSRRTIKCSEMTIFNGVVSWNAREWFVEDGCEVMLDTSYFVDSGDDVITMSIERAFTYEEIKIDLKPFKHFLK